ncbi:MAG: LytTR family DNA-binding domain-containing protein [Lachnospiraceae bacterium]|nr:LytTR family DNA-binding domain-containing protein [Lachnospiraceae bacterium]
MQIAICDDIQKDLETIRTALDTYAEAHPELHFDIDEYNSAEDILEAAKNGRTYDIALLDVCLSDGLGTDVAEEMLSKSLDMSIVFLSTSSEYSVMAFALNATHYLLKPFSQEQFNAALDRAVKKTEDQRFLTLACVDGMYRVRVTEIVSLESQNHYLRINLSSGRVLQMRTKLSQVFEELQEYPGFIKVGVSYAVNLAFVRRVSGNTLEIHNGFKISIPRRSSEEVKKAYMDFWCSETLK